MQISVDEILSKISAMKAKVFALEADINNHMKKIHCITLLRILSIEFSLDLPPPDLSSFIFLDNLPDCTSFTNKECQLDKSPCWRKRQRKKQRKQEKRNQMGNKQN